MLNTIVTQTRPTFLRYQENLYNMPTTLKIQYDAQLKSQSYNCRLYYNKMRLSRFQESYNIMPASLYITTHYVNHNNNCIELSVLLHKQSRPWAMKQKRL